MNKRKSERSGAGHRQGGGSRLLFAGLSLLFVLGLASGAWLGAVEDNGVSGADSIYKYLTLWEEVLRLIRGSYVEETDGRSLMAGALDGVTDALDPFSVYVPAAEVPSYRSAQEIGRRHSGALVLKERGTAYVAAVDRGSPAERAGLERADIVAGMNGRSSRDMPLWELRRQLAGPVGSELRLELVRRGDSIERTLTLAEYESPPVEFEEVRGVGVLTIASFGAETATQVEGKLAGFAGEELLIDLRGVAGGSEEGAYEVAAAFVDGRLGALLERDDRAREAWNDAGGDAGASSPVENVWSGEITVLTDRSSQGAAEIVTAVLKQSAEAEHYGEPTFGYAGAREQIGLAGGDLLDLTTAFYTGPDLERLDESIRPDERVGSLFFGKPEDGSDPVLERSLDLILGAESAG